MRTIYIIYNNIPISYTHEYTCAVCHYWRIFWDISQYFIQNRPRPVYIHIHIHIDISVSNKNICVEYSTIGNFVYNKRTVVITYVTENIVHMYIQYISNVYTQYIHRSSTYSLKNVVLRGIALSNRPTSLS